jgi:tRNA/tmRNA/rRNA uracil-C5-methylase (TrmA/RlmC/RlmD family)
MPHNWASAEFIRMARHMVMLERGNELHLFEGLPVAWTKPGDKTVLKDIPTTFGKAGIELEMSKDGKFANVRIAVPDRENLEKVVLHLEQFDRKVKSVTKGFSNIKDKTVKISPAKKIVLKIEFEYTLKGSTPINRDRE